MIVELIPGHGIPGIPFGTPREHARAILRERFGDVHPSPRGELTDCYFGNSLQLAYEADDTLSFIEVSAPPPVYAEVYGIKTWQVTGKELMKRIKRVDTVRHDASSSGEGPLFESGLTLWDLDTQYDHEQGGRRKMWGTIGIGDQRYIRSIDRIKHRLKLSAGSRRGPMATRTRLLLFLGLIGFYVLVVTACGLPVRIFTSRWHGLGIDYYAVGAWLACFASGPFIGPMEPYPFRSGYVLLGVMIMVGMLGLRVLAAAG